MSPEQVVQMLEEKIRREKANAEYMQPVYRGEPAEISQPVYRGNIPIEAMLAGKRDPSGYRKLSQQQPPIEDQLRQLWTLFGRR